MAKHKPEICTIRDDHNRLLAGKEPQVYRDDGRHDNKATRHLVHQYRTTAYTHADPVVADGIKGTDSRRHHTYHNAIAIAGIERENTHHTSHRNQRKKELPTRKALLEDHRLEQSRKESYQREADDTNRHVRGLDATIEQNPVQSQQGSTSAQLQEFPPADTR